MSGVRAVMWGVIGALATVVAVAAPASAHDELLASTPTAQAQLHELPAEIELTFSAAILPDGAEIAVIDDEGDNRVASDPAIGTNTLTVALDEPGDTSDAGYLVQWRVVSSDGHPISGTIPFAVGSVAPPAGDTTAAAPIQAATADAGTPIAVVIAGIAFAALVVALVVFLVLARRRGGSR
ncbi:copper resistance protein CopC [Microbacterium sp.]|uniref:copper resistance CopC family protein n=1 Tax=Microbacterium sp. TaxID=51671 RepID=UPI0037369B43